VDFSQIGTLIAEESGGLTHAPGDIEAWSAANVAPVVQSDLFGRVQLTHVNLNDMTVEGIRLLDAPAFSVQYHPESAPGPHDSRYLFDAFARLMAGEADYLSAAGEGTSHDA
jgi:carbamoyl-phosphate synthase small subunit